ncbi:MAG: CocE/NonD family hydrolase [Actinomycetota bacterium]
MSPRSTSLRLVGTMLAVALAWIVLPAVSSMPGTRAAAEGPNSYVTLSDGTSIALNVRMPARFKKGETYPTIFEMSGYDGGSADGDDPVAGKGSRALTEMFERDYVTVHASVRGSGCSGGEFDLFSWRSALDGRELIEWITKQKWSNGDVGIYGHSYGGITGFMVAATRPPGLKAVSASGLIDDLYRGITYPGGVVNYGFPLLWTGVIRPVYDVGGGSLPGLAAGDRQCILNHATHSRDVFNDPLLQGLDDTDNNWWRSRSLITYAERIRVPIHISGAYQDEQTGPRGPYHLFEAVDNARYRRLLMTNGDHGTQTNPRAMYTDRKAWMDHWLRGKGRRPNRTSVTALLEMSDDDVPNGRLDARTFPLENSNWTEFFLRADGGLARRAPGARGGSDQYFSGSPRQFWSYQAGEMVGPPFTTADAPDELTFRTKRFRKAKALVGPMTAELFVSSTSPIPDLYVQVIDEAPDGTRYYLQRGMLKTSHRAVNRSLSDQLADGTIYRPFRPHTNPTPVEVNKTYKYLVEVFPVGHVLRPGHRLMVVIHNPPAVDSYYVYVPKSVPGINTVWHNRASPSHLTLPFVPLRGSGLGPELPRCGLQQVRCVPGD